MDVGSESTCLPSGRPVVGASPGPDSGLVEGFPNRSRVVGRHTRSGVGGTTHPSELIFLETSLSGDMYSSTHLSGRSRTVLSGWLTVSTYTAPLSSPPRTPVSSFLRRTPFRSTSPSLSSIVT